VDKVQKAGRSKPGEETGGSFKLTDPQEGQNEIASKIQQDEQFMNTNCSEHINSLLLFTILQAFILIFIAYFLSSL